MELLSPFPKRGIKLKCLQKIRDFVNSIDPAWTTTDLCDKLIKPLTKSHHCSFADFIQICTPPTNTI